MQPSGSSSPNACSSDTTSSSSSTQDNLCREIETDCTSRMDNSARQYRQLNGQKNRSHLTYLDWSSTKQQTDTSIQIQARFRERTVRLSEGVRFICHHTSPANVEEWAMIIITLDPFSPGGFFGFILSKELMISR